jgi:catechol 2,3-dioxygenase
MATTKEDIFGEARGVSEATAGSFGLPPSGFRLPEDTGLGPVRLQVGDLERSLAYYQEVLGFGLFEREATRALLGSGAPLVELRERRRARPAPRRGRTGLFHFAILVPDRPSLGRFVRHLDELDLQAGAADHLVSEAFYLQDPDNLGIEVYVDRPRSAWRRVGRELMMATDPIDVAGLLQAAGDERWNGAPPGTVIGHVHLHVNDLAAAAAFYSEGLGFDRTVWGYPGALFLGAGGYHHHLGTNLWAGANAAPPAADEAQLLEWTIELPDAQDLEAASASLTRGGYSVERLGSEFTTRDPWGTGVRLRVGESASGRASRPTGAG